MEVAAGDSAQASGVGAIDGRHGSLNESQFSLHPLIGKRWAFYVVEIFFE